MGALICCQSAHCVQVVRFQRTKRPSVQPTTATTNCLPEIDVHADVCERIAPPVLSDERDEPEKESLSKVVNAAAARKESAQLELSSQTRVDFARNPHGRRKSEQYARPTSLIIEAQRSQSLGEGLSRLRLSDYLCTCDHCPLARSIESAFSLDHNDELSTPVSSATCQRRQVLLRILRACATYDETRKLDRKVLFYAEKLLVERGMDEDQVFRHVVAFIHQPPERLPSTRSMAA